MRPEIVQSDVAYQLQGLIVEPLAAMEDHLFRCVIVIDALDECKDDATISVILAALSYHVEKLYPLKILLTSRPEHNINLAFSERGLQAATRNLVLHEINLKVVEEDIRTYLVSQLELFKRRYNIKGPWPSGREITSLVKSSCGLFIFAATSIKFISDTSYDDPRGQLKKILRNKGTMGHDLLEPQHHLDQLYLQVLKDAHPKLSPSLAEQLRLTLGTIVLLQDPLSINSIQKLLRAQLGNISIRQLLMRLQSIILVPEEDSKVIRVLHPSLADFIIDPIRCSSSEFLVNTPIGHSSLLKACLHTMQGLKQNICKLSDPNLINSDVPDMIARLEKFIPPELRYACRHWGMHFQHANLSEDILELLHEFCVERLLFWVEACSLLGDLRNQLIHLDIAQRVLKVSLF